MAHKDRIDESVLEKVTLGRNQKHIILCVEESCGDAQGPKSWSYLKKRLRQEGLDKENVLRTKAGCLRICRQGPIAVIYPEGLWYHSVDEELIDELIETYIKGGRILEKNKFAVDSLGR